MDNDGPPGVVVLQYLFEPLCLQSGLGFVLECRFRIQSNVADALIIDKKDAVL